MNSKRRTVLFIRSVSAFFGTILSFLITPDDSGSGDSSLGDGSDIFGEHNFRTGKADSGTDPDGWYEEDM